MSSSVNDIHDSFQHRTISQEIIEDDESFGTISL